MQRQDTLLKGVNKSARILEIGAGYNPLAPKAAGWNSFTLDHASRRDLVEKYAADPAVDETRIEPVDFIWRDGPVSSAVSLEHHGTFDRAIASHVVEHITDLVGFLVSLEALLAPDGKVILAVPDKRFCFDFFRPLSTTGQIIAAHLESSNRHAFASRFDQHAYGVTNSEEETWGQEPVQDLRFTSSLEATYNLVGGDGVSREGGPYLDSHAWQFVPASFELIMLELAALNFTDLRIEEITPAMGCEFFVWLGRGGKQAAALEGDDLNARRMRLLKRSLIETRLQADSFSSRTSNPARAIVT